MRELRSVVGAEVPIVATYYPASAPDYDLIATEKRLCDYGADAVLSHPFGHTQFYSALEKALGKHK